MYGTTIRSFNENKEIKEKKSKKDKSFYTVNESKKDKKKLNKKDLDTKYMKINGTAMASEEEGRNANEGFSIKDLPIASVVITVILTMMMLVMTSGFGGL